MRAREAGTDAARKVRSSFKGGEMKRALAATALGLALGSVIALFLKGEFSKKPEKDGVNGA